MRIKIKKAKKSARPAAKTTPASHVESAPSPIGQPSAPPLPQRLQAQLPKDKPAGKSQLKSLGGETVTVRTLIEAASPAHGVPSTNLDDTTVDKAVDDIVAKEGDLSLAVDDVRTARRNPVKLQAAGGTSCEHCLETSGLGSVWPLCCWLFSACR